MYDTLIINGSGISGISYFGVFQDLSSRGILQNIKSFVGASAGAYVAVLLAYGFNPDELVQIYKKIDFSKQLGKHFFLYTLFSLIFKWGLFDISTIIKTTKSILSQRHSPDLTFQELYDLTGKKLTIYVTEVSTNSAKALNKDISPNTKIIDALQASISIPVFFIPKRHSFFGISELYVDGAFGIKLHSDNPKSLVVNTVNEVQIKPTNFFGYIYNIISLIFMETNFIDSENSLEIAMKNRNVFDFNIEENDIDELVRQGKQASEYFFMH